MLAWKILNAKGFVMALAMMIIGGCVTESQEKVTIHVSMTKIITVSMIDYYLSILGPTTFNFPLPNTLIFQYHFSGQQEDPNGTDYDY